MNAVTPRFLLLSPKLGWRERMPEAAPTGATGMGLFGLRLSALADGPLGLNAPDGSVGGLLLPAGVALDSGFRTYLLNVRTARADLLAFDFEARRFVPMADTMNIPLPSGAVRHTGYLAAVGDRLYLGFRRAAEILVYDARRETFLPPVDVRRTPGLTGDPDALRVTDIQTDGVDLYVLDAEQETILVLPNAASAQPSALRVAVAHYEPPADIRGSARRLLVDRNGSLYLMYPPYGDRGSVLAAINAGGRLVSPYPRHGPADSADGWRPPLISDTNDVRPLFPSPAIRLSEDGIFVLPPDLTAECERRFPADPPSPEDPLHALRTAWRGACLVFDRNGVPVAPPSAMRPRPRLYEQDGLWFSEALDSRLTDCQWHRVEVELERMPSESSVTISTFTTDDVMAGNFVVDAAGNLSPEDEFVWATEHTIYREDIETDPERGFADEFLIQSRGGRYLWIRVGLNGDGHQTPILKAVRIHYPRHSYLGRLPEIFRSNPENQWFLGRFLSVFQTDWDGLQERIRAKSQLASPSSVPEGALMTFLGKMVGMKFDPNTDAAARRSLLEIVPATYPVRGTVQGLHRFLTTCLASVSGWPADKLGPLVNVVEGFRERDRILLRQEQTGGLSDGGTLWGADIMNRTQLDNAAIVGRSELSDGDERTDLFRRYANRIAIYAPAALLDTPEKERVLRNVIEAEKPAHVDYCLCLVDPVMRLGFQSTLGIDTVVGDRPSARTVGDVSAYPGAHGGRLSVDTVLGPSNRERRP